MIHTVIKADGTEQPFEAEKLNKWCIYAAKYGGDWSAIALETYRKLPEKASSDDIHQTMIDVCYSKEDIVYSRLAARLEVAQLRKNMERKLGVKPNLDPWLRIRGALIKAGVWCGETMPTYSTEQEDLYQEVKKVKLEAWQVSQWADKYLMKLDDVVVETPQIAAMGIGLSLLGDNKDGHDLVRNIAYSKVNLPTPILNGCRDGTFDGVSCCVISAGDTVDSVDVAEHIAAKMSSKKAGLGIEFTTRSKGSPVRNGMFKHLGKHSIYASLDTTVKKWMQVTRGGSATVTFNVIDPEVEQIALWKSQRIDIESRLDKLDYSFAFNDAFLDAVIKRKDWYLFDYADAPEVWGAFYTASVDEYNQVVQDHLDAGVKHKKESALDLIKHLLVIRNETGRMYCINVSRANQHTPFVDIIKLSNLCQEIFLPTKAYKDMTDLYNDDSSGVGGETAFCSLAALVPHNIKPEEYKDVAYNAVLAVTTLIVKCPKMTKNHKRTMLARKSLGIGITGLAEWLYSQGMDYDGSDASLEAVHDLFERHYYYLLEASIKLVSEGLYEAVEGVTDWLPVDTKVSKYSSKMGWEALRGKPRANSVLVALMPTESSSLASGVSNGVYVPRSKIINKKSRKGLVQFICEPFAEGKSVTAWDVDNITMSRYYGVAQDWVDQGASADTYFDPTKYEDAKKPMSDLLKEWVAHFRLGNKSMYYVNTRDVGMGSVHDLLLEAAPDDEDGCTSCTL